MKKRDVVFACVLLMALGAALPLASIICADPETVTVTYVDGRTEKGELIDKTPDKIVIRLTEGVNHLDVPIPWARIASISNGLTRADEISQWKSANAGKLCPECGGDRLITCKKCDGTGLLPRPLVACTACKGTGVAPCSAKGCENGKVPCPGNCMKLTEGKWVPDKDGLLWRRFRQTGGWVDWNERHVGDVIELKDGKIVNSGPCPICNRTTKVTCKLCGGTGTTECTLCKGTKQIPEPGPDKKCDACSGKKTVTCPTCKGTGLKP